MAKKTIFISTQTGFYEDEVEYTFHAGFAVIQKQKNISSIEYAVKQRYPKANVLEVSTKSNDELGFKLSAFNLKLNGTPIESIFQSSKVFVDETQFDFVIDYSSRDAKKYLKENAKGQLKCFRYNGKEYPLFPETAFYDYIYIQALVENNHLSDHLKIYDVFTDIEFYSHKSINCQARTCAIYSYLLKSGKVQEYISSFDNFLKLYKMDETISLL